MGARVWVAAVAVLAGTLAGCGDNGGSTDRAGIGAAPSGSPPPVDVLREQARVALEQFDEAWNRATASRRFVPVESLNGTKYSPADGEGALEMIVPVTKRALPAAPRPTGPIRWDDGPAVTVPLVGALEALQQMAIEAADGCTGCKQVEVTGARPTRVEVETTRGRATAPAWEFTVKGTKETLTRVAVDPAAVLTVVTPRWDPYNTPHGLAVEKATTTGGTRDASVSFTGSKGPATESCGTDYTAEAVESANAVVILLRERHHSRGDACTAVGYPRTASVTLTRPLGDRTVLEVTRGLPVPVTITR